MTTITGADDGLLSIAVHEQTCPPIGPFMPERYGGAYSGPRYLFSLSV